SSRCSGRRESADQLLGQAPLRRRKLFRCNKLSSDEPGKMSQEIEIKFRVDDLRALGRKLRAAGFDVTTRRTHEMNALYDLPGGVLRARKELLRLRQYGTK